MYKVTMYDVLYYGYDKLKIVTVQHVHVLAQKGTIILRTGFI